MKERLIKAKEFAKRNLPVLIPSAIAGVAIGVLIHNRQIANGWTAYVLNQESRDLMAGNPDACVTFPETKVMILGQPWNPDK